MRMSCCKRGWQTAEIEQTLGMEEKKNQEDGDKGGSVVVILYEAEDKR